MAAVAGVINNRAKWGCSRDLGSVVKEPHQFEPWQNSKTRAWMLNLPKDSPEYQAAAAVALPIFAGMAQPDPTQGATAFYGQKLKRRWADPRPVFDDGSGVAIGNQLYFQGDYRRTS